MTPGRGAFVANLVNTALRWRLAVMLVAAVALAGCSGKFTYPNTHAKNLRIHTQTDSGSMFSSVRAAVGIYGVDAGCRIEYEGTVDLDETSRSVGLPADRPSYLVFEFASASFLANSRRSITYETLLKPLPGHRYDVEVSYRDDIYNVEIREMRPGGAPARRLRQQDLRACASV